MQDVASLFHLIASGLENEHSADDIDQFRKAYHQFQDRIEEILTGNGRLETTAGAQSKQFMVQLLPIIQGYMRRFEQGHHFSILDIGLAHGHGSDFLASLYGRSTLGYRARVSSLDIRKNYRDFMKIACRHAHIIGTEVSKIAQVFDIVIGSHVIEHLPEPRKFIERMQQLSRGVVILCAPYEEPRLSLTRGHINVFDEDFLESLKADDIQLVESPAWGAFKSPPYKMFIAVLRGTAVQKQAA